jgi:tetratricopeptide (TPR) repeat protein
MNELETRLEELEETGELFPAIKILDQLVQENPENFDYQLRLGILCVQVGEVDRAEKILRACLEAGTDGPRVQLNMGHALKALGKTEQAVECYLQVANGEDNVQAAIGCWSLANMKNYRFDDLLIARMRGRAQFEDMPVLARGLLLFALAAAWEQKKLYEKAFMSMSEANLIIANHRPFRADLYGQLVHSLVQNFSTPVELPTLEGPVPIFILGMRRSGTTLVEQILACHSEVESTDELPFLNRIGLELEARGGYARALGEFNAERQAHFGRAYLDKVDQYRKLGRGYFLDKMPVNFLHIGLIKTLFPNAKIINLVRDPLDNAIGVYKMYFSEGMEYSFSFDGIVYYWQGYLTLMKHWEGLYPGQIYHLSYESLVEKPDEKIKEILDYCGLAVEEQCFRFYESERPVLTPSAGQVRSPISAKSVGSGLKYAQFIKPVIPKMGEIKHKAIEIFGFEKPST